LDDLLLDENEVTRKSRSEQCARAKSGVRDPVIDDAVVGVAADESGRLELEERQHANVGGALASGAA
jgi:hypothetical protein